MNTVFAIVHLACLFCFTASEKRRVAINGLDVILVFWKMGPL